MEKNTKKTKFKIYRDKQLKKSAIYLRKIESSAKKNNYLSISLLSLSFILLFLPMILSKKIFQELRNLEDGLEIKLRVKGKGDINILYNSFNPLPSELVVNDYSNPSSRKIYRSTEGESEVIIKFASPITSCEKMFYGLTNIVSIFLCETFIVLSYDEIKDDFDK